MHYYVAPQYQDWYYNISNIDEINNISKSKIHYDIPAFASLFYAVTSGKNCGKNEGFARIGSQCQQS